MRIRTDQMEIARVQVCEDAATQEATAKLATPSELSDDLPRACPTGTKTYYQCRQKDFLRRHPQPPAPPPSPPSYYMNYGQKYLERFSAYDDTDLSPKGLEWRDNTLRLLQEAMEKKRLEDPESFDLLEQDDGAFKRFAFDTHPDAYIDGGLFDLPAKDLLKIVATPDFKDLAGPDGLRQVGEVWNKMEWKDFKKIIDATF